MFSFLVMGLGFSCFSLSSLLINKKKKLLNREYFLYSYILILVFFVIFAKLFYILLEFKFEYLINFIFADSWIDVVKFLISGYAFIGGYVGVILACWLFSKISKINFKEILVLYLPSLLLMYGIMKINCFLAGCCGGVYPIPVQLMESLVSIILYVAVYFNLKKNTDFIVGISLLSFAVPRFCLSFFRVYNNYYTLLLVEIICLCLIMWGLLKLKSNIKRISA